MPPKREISGESREERVSSCWGGLSGAREDKSALRKVAWAEHPITEAYINLRITGNPDRNWVDWAFSDFIVPPAHSGLSIGCGSGYIERRIIDNSYSDSMVGIDISEESLELAKREAGDRPIKYRVFDLNRDKLEENTYDFVISAAALHHVTNLEHCFSQIHRSLKEGGLLIMHEYVGPDRFQWSRKQLDIVNRIYLQLPERYKFNHLTGMKQVKVEKKPFVHMIKADPSEAVRSSAIVDVLGEFFDIIEIKKIGGTLLHPLLEGVIGNFPDNDRLSNDLLKMLVSLEERMIESGSLDADFLALAACKKSPGLTPEEAMQEGKRQENTINMQEEEILTLNRRLEEAQEQALRLRDQIEEHMSQLEKMRKEREALVEENATLKSRGPLKYAKYLRARMMRKH